MAIIQFTDETLPSEVRQLNEKDIAIQSQAISGSAKDNASKLIDNMFKEQGTFQSMKHNNVIQKALNLFEPHTITIKEN